MSSSTSSSGTQPSGVRVSSNPVDGVLTIKGPHGQSVLLLALSGDTNSAQFDLMIGPRLYTIAIQPKPGAGTPQRDWGP